MSKDKSTISQAQSYQEIGDFWDTHDLADYGDQPEPVDFDVDIRTEATCFALDRQLSRRLARTAQERGVSAETLLNMGVQKKIRERDPAPVL